MRFRVHQSNSGYYGMSKGLTKEDAIKLAIDWCSMGGARFAEVTRGVRGASVFEISHKECSTSAIRRK